MASEPITDELIALCREIHLPCSVQIGRTIIGPGCRLSTVLVSIRNRMRVRSISIVIGVPPVICTWQEDADRNLHTDCGQIFVLDVETPPDNDMRFCCYCGRKLHYQPYEEGDTDV